MADRFGTGTAGKRLRNLIRAFVANRSLADSDVIPAMRVKAQKITIGADDPDSDVNIVDGSETDSGIDLPVGSVVLGAFVETLTVEATGGTPALDVGLLSGESGGDADGFLDAVGVDVLATDGTPEGVLLTGGLKHAITTAVSVSVTAGSADFAELRAALYVLYFEPEGV